MAGCEVWVTENSVIYCEITEQGAIQQKRILAVWDHLGSSKSRARTGRS